MHQGVGRQKRTGSDLGMTRQGAMIGHQDSIAHVTIVRYMGPDHQQTVVANPRITTGLGSSMHRNILTQDGPLADHHTARFSGPGHILWIVPHHRMHVDFGITADLSTRTDVSMAKNLATGVKDRP